MTNQQLIDAINQAITTDATLLTLVRFAVNNAFMTMDNQHLSAIYTALNIQPPLNPPS